MPVPFFGLAPSERGRTPCLRYDSRLVFRLRRDVPHARAHQSQNAQGGVGPHALGALSRGGIALTRRGIAPRPCRHRLCTPREELAPCLCHDSRLSLRSCNGAPTEGADPMPVPPIGVSARSERGRAPCLCRLTRLANACAYVEEEPHPVRRSSSFGTRPKGNSGV